ncbi:hypothetical protein C1Y40_04122 [Mycobacterium talmoniae]|uniref:Uncharacterized protein n=1 Tax=Mycobacterium talmoniae TaxID=1858794 RepID=A0A2S8BGC5_9MYCO|nr:hypothetical protein [Mycobacterium eburneum]PQM45678.1 hypothetical protein C1Y40_04122 [Mycobacterium talmoniae]TDH57537.1 hypothetical protein E2F47_01850 [Mycobacterium eburneum]
MPRDDAAQLIARGLPSLPHPDGRPRRLMHFSQFGRDDATAQKVGALANEIGESIVHLLERGGYTLVHKDDPKPADAEGYKTVVGKCALCGKQLLRFGVDENLSATFTRIALKSFAALNPECPHD